MISAINNISSIPGYFHKGASYLSMVSTYLGGPVSPIQVPSENKDQELSLAIKKVYTKQEEKIEASLNDIKGRVTSSCGPLIINDIIDSLFVVFTLGKAIFPKLSSLHSVTYMSFGFGIVGGVLNLIVGGVCIKEAITALNNGDKFKGICLLVSGLGILALGVFMIVSEVTVHTAIGTFIAMNPWILPLIFVIIYLPLFVEIARANKDILLSQDPYSKLNLNRINDLLKDKDIDWKKIRDQLEGSDLDYNKVKAGFDQNSTQSLIDLIEDLKAKMRPQGAVSSFKLFEAILNEDKENAKAEIKALKGHATVWKNAYRIRMIQQIVFIVSTILGIILLKRVSSALSMQSSTDRVVNILTKLFVLIGTTIPLYMDTKRPFHRNTAMFIETPKLEEIKT